MQGIGKVRLIAQGREDIFFESIPDWDNTMENIEVLDDLSSMFSEKPAAGVAPAWHKVAVETDSREIIALVEIEDTGSLYGRIQIYIECEEFEEVEAIPLPEERKGLIAEREEYDGGDNYGDGRKETETIGFPRLPGPLPGYGNS